MSVEFKSLTFLLIEDSQTFLVAVTKMLKDLNVKSFESTSKGEKAIQLLKETKFDVVMCDYNLRDSLNGQQILEQVRFEKLLAPDAAFLMVTGDPDVENLTTSIEARADDYIIKPVSFDLLKKHLEYVIDFKKRVAPVLVAIDNNQFSKAQTESDKVIKEKPQYVLPILRLKAETYISQDQFEEARKIYSKILEHKNIPWAQFGLAQSHYFLENHPNAEKILEQVINDKENFTIAYDWLAKVQVALDEKPEALETLSKAVSIAPNSLIRQMEIANIAKELEKYELSARSYKRAITLAENSYYKTPGIYLSLAQVIIQQAKKADAFTADEQSEVLKLTEEARTKFRKEKLVQIESYLLEAKMHTAAGVMELQQAALQQAFTTYKDVSLSPVQEAKAAVIFYDYGEPKFAHDICQAVGKKSDFSGEPMDIIGTILKHTPKSIEAAKCFEAGDHKGAYDGYLGALKECPKSLEINLHAMQAILAYAEHNGDITSLKEPFQACINNINQKKLSKAQINKYDELKLKFNNLQQ